MGRRWGARFAPPPPFNSLAEFLDGPATYSAINDLIAATPAGGILELPEQVFASSSVEFNQLQNIVCPPGGARIRGAIGVRVRRMLVSDPGWDQITPSLRSSVNVVDLKANGVTDWGTFLPFQNDPGQFSSSNWYGGFNAISLGLPSLTVDDRQMELTRWPAPTAVDQPWTFAYMASGGAMSTFTASDLTPFPDWSEANWESDNLVAVSMYPYDATDSEDYYTSATIPDGVTVTLTVPLATAPGPNCRFVIQNVLEQLLVPGQFYIDVNNLLLYFIPPDGLPDHAYRVTWTTDPLVTLYAGKIKACSGSTFTGGPLMLCGCRGNGMTLSSDSAPLSCPGGLTFENVQAFGIGVDAFGFENSVGAAAPAGWSIGTLVVDWCGACGMWLGPAGGTGNGTTIPPIPDFPTLDHWGTRIGEMFLGRTSQWCRTYRAGAHFNCVGCTVESIVSFQNPNHHVIHDSHDFVVKRGFFDGSFTEGGDVGIIYSAQDPTIFGTEFHNLTFVNIPTMTDNLRGTFQGRRALYVDNWGSGVTARNITCVNCNSMSNGEADYCVVVNGGQACTIDGVQTINCLAQPVEVAANAGLPWEPGNTAYNSIFSANVADGRYQGKYGLPWAQMLESLGGTPAGLPINNSVLRIYPDINSAGQPDLRGSSFALGCPINQPQGAVAPGAVPPFPPPLN